MFSKVSVAPEFTHKNLNGRLRSAHMQITFKYWSSRNREFEYRALEQFPGMQMDVLRAGSWTCRSTQEWIIEPHPSGLSFFRQQALNVPGVLHAATVWHPKCSWEHSNHVRIRRSQGCFRLKCLWHKITNWKASLGFTVFRLNDSLCCKSPLNSPTALHVLYDAIRRSTKWMKSELTELKGYFRVDGRLSGNKQTCCIFHKGVF